MLNPLGGAGLAQTGAGGGGGGGGGGGAAVVRDSLGSDLTRNVVGFSTFLTVDLEPGNWLIQIHWRMALAGAGNRTVRLDFSGTEGTVHGYQHLEGTAFDSEIDTLTIDQSFGVTAGQTVRQHFHAVVTAAGTLTLQINDAGSDATVEAGSFIHAVETPDAPIAG